MQDTTHLKCQVERTMARQGRLIVICGLPGSGKTTLAKALEVERSAIRLSADDWMMMLAINLHDEQARSRIEALQWSVCQQLLAQGLAIIIEWGSWGREERDVLRSGARQLGASVELHYLAAPTDVLFQRIQRRAMEDPPVTREMLDGWAARIQVPTEEEMRLFDPPETTA